MSFDLRLVSLTFHRNDVCVCVCVCVCGTNIPAHVASSPSNGYKSWAEAWVVDEATPHVLGITENYLQLLFFPPGLFFHGIGL